VGRLAPAAILFLACAGPACGEAPTSGVGARPIPTDPALRAPGEGDRPPDSVPPPPPRDPRLEQARMRFMEGVRLYEAGSYGDALQQFSAAYELAPRPEILFNIATCQEHLGDIRGAVVTYQHYLADGADQPGDQQQMVRDKIRVLESQLGIER
jgi:tetratricopeptide (TPR) repeat protein